MTDMLVLSMLILAGAVGTLLMSSGSPQKGGNKKTRTKKRRK